VSRGITYYRRRRPDGRVCGVLVTFTGELSLSIAWSCDGAETRMEIDAKEFTDDPVTCFVCITEGKS